MDSVIDVERIEVDSRKTISVKEEKHDEIEVANEEEVELIIEEDGDDDERQKNQVISVGEQMQIMCDLYGFKQDTYWDSYRDDQQEALKNKLALIVSHEFVDEKNLVSKFGKFFKNIYSMNHFTDRKRW